MDNRLNPCRLYVWQHCRSYSRHRPPEAHGHIHGCSPTRYATVKAAYRSHVRIRLSTYFSSLLHFRCLNVHSDVERSLAVSVFRLDPDKFNQRLSQLESAGHRRGDDGRWVLRAIEPPVWLRLVGVFVRL